MDSSHTLFAEVTPSARLVVEADFDPQLPTRVLGRFAELGRLPASFVARNRDEQSVRVEVEFAAEPEAARLLSRRLLNLPSVRSVELSFHRARAARAA